MTSTASSRPSPKRSAPTGRVRRRRQADLRSDRASDEDGEVVAKGAQKLTKAANDQRAGASLQIAGKKKLKVKLKTVRATLSAGERKTLKLKPKGKKQARKLRQAVKRGARAKAKIKLSFADEAGNVSNEKLSLKLQ